ncbi:MAG: sigma-54 factor interaction protein [Proteobacteria bacterium]|jgi:DNA-binding NtrC family response regulator|nr:sigma-54 factor interaction protein [Pseudomonadota bacterium]
MRKLLVLSSAAVEDEVIQKISAADWEVYSAQDPSQARVLLTEQSFRVGLALLFSCEPERSIQWVIDLMLSRRKMQWVIALPRPCVERKSLSNLIAEWCYDYHTLPIDTQRLVVTLGHAYGMAELTETHLRQQREAEAQYGLIGNSPAMQTLFRGIQKAAEVDVPVLITGEIGTGKELVARVIHENSSRAAAPFMAVNCEALTSDLIQSELFGHEKGAFAGASERRIGQVEAATGGTLFLDEVVSLGLEAQANLLRFLEEKKIRRLGGSKPIPANVRVIAATHTSIEQAIREGRFREDLFYRLNVLHLRAPTLRERRGDVELLARYFFNKFSAEVKTVAKGFNRDALEVINRYDWPGNVRELMNRVRRAVLLSEGPYISPADLELERRSLGRGFVTLDEARMAADREVIQATLLRTRFNIARAAQELSVSRMTLYRLMEKYDIRRDNL